MQDFIEELAHIGLTARLKRLSDRLKSEAKAIYRFLELEIEPNWHLIFLLLKDRSLSVTEIAKQIGFSHPAVIKITSGMKEKGYLVSRSDMNDSRRKILSLTQKSHDLLPEYQKHWTDIKNIIQTCATEEFLSSIKHLEEKLAQKSMVERLRDLKDDPASSVKIVNSTKEDLPMIMACYSAARSYMAEKKQVVWPVFSKELVLSEIEEKNQWKMLLADKVVGVWATTFEDALIWGKEYTEPAVYIHRIAKNPVSKHNILVREIIRWAKKYAKRKAKEFIRLDTVGLNHGLINHYEKQGFKYLGTRFINDTSALPKHYSEGPVCLFQLAVN
ncbi:MAG: MarR family winged helix-turn-helix transcriptional regulator [Bacteroidota bacterium]